MTLEQLRIFVAVAEREHVTRAAQALHLTQSAVSGAVAALEARHSVKLFDRVGRAIVLNEAGRAFLAEARGVLLRAGTAEAVLEDLGALRRGRLTLHASQTIAGYWLPPRLVAFRAAHPSIELAVAIGNTAQVARAVAEGEAELGYVEGSVDDPLLVREQVDSDRLIIVVPSAHAWATGEGLVAKDLPRSLWVLREEGSGTRSTFAAALAAAGLSEEALPLAMVLPSNEAVLAAVMCGAGATAISERVAAAALARGDVKRAGFALEPRPFSLLRHAARYRSRAGDAFAAMSRAMAEAVPGS